MAVPGFEDLSKAFGNPFAVSAFRQPYVCAQMLSRGFTTVRDCGGATLALKEAIEDGVFPGPRLFISCHALSQTGGHADIRVSFPHFYLMLGVEVEDGALVGVSVYETDDV